MRLYAGEVPNSVIGTEIDYFVLPPVDAGIGEPLVGDVTLATGLTDRPEVRRLLTHFADPAFGSLWAPNVGPLPGPPPANGFLPVNRRFDLAAFGPSDDPFVGVKLRMTDDLWSALDAGTLRGAVADVMPRSIGGRDGTRQNAFNAGMIDWVTRERTIEEVFAAIDAEWDAVKARGED